MMEFGGIGILPMIHGLEAQATLVRAARWVALVRGDWMRFAAFGRTRMLYDTIRALVAAGHSPTIIGTCRAAPESAVREQDFARLATELRVDFFESAAINSDDIVGRLAQSGSDVAVSVNWLTVVGERVCGLFPHGVLNGHAGDLPRYRGNAPYAYAIIENEPWLGICIHQMEAGVLDSGPVLVRRQVPITGSTYVGDLLDACERFIPGMFCEALGGLEEGSIAPVAQSVDPSMIIRCYPRKPEDGLIDWSLPAEAICRLVRASSRPFAGAYTFLENRKVILWRARAQASPCRCLGTPGQVVERRASGEVAVLTPEGFVVVEELSRADGISVAPTALVTSLRQRFGLNLAVAYERLVSEIEQMNRGCDSL